MTVFFGVVVFVGLSVSTLEHGPVPDVEYLKVGKQVTRIITRMSGTGDSPRGKLHYDAYVSLQSGCAGRKAYYGRPAKATCRLARQAQQHLAASQPVRGGIEPTIAAPSADHLRELRRITVPRTQPSPGQ